MDIEAEAHQDAAEHTAETFALDRYRWEMVKAHLSTAVSYAEDMEDGKRALGEALCAALDTVAGGAPLYPVDQLTRVDADWWADTATPMELEVYTAAALKRIQRVDFAPRARKRLFVDLWKGMTDDDRMAFLRNVDPGGKFIGGSRNVGG